MRLRTTIPSLRPLGLAILLIGAVCAPTRANAQLDFDFSFDATSGTVPGLVTGEIIGLEDNATSRPTSVIIDSAPAGLGLTFPDTVPNIDASGAGFTVSSGEITAQNYFIGSYLAIDFGLIDDQDLEGPGGFASSTGAVTYTPVPTVTATPEPPGLLLLGTGLLTLTGASRRQPLKPLSR